MIIFDFDGVLINSVDEVLVSAFCTLSGVITAELSALPPDYIALFRKYRFLVQSASDIPVLAKWCLTQRSDAGALPLSKKEFLGLLESDPIAAQTRREQLFSIRNEIVEQFPEAWVNLNKPYQPLWKSLQRRSSDPLIILTHKNCTAVVDICRHFALKVDPANVYSGDRGHSKIENLKAIHQRFGRNAQTFVDDNVHNLIELQQGFPDFTDLSLALALWGYVGSADVALAARHRFLTLTQEQLVARF